MRVFDSNVLIYYLNGALPGDLRAQVDAWIDEGSVISVITRIEVLGFRQPVSEERRAFGLLALLQEESLHEAIVQQTIRVRRQRRIRLPDAVIAATALHLGLPVVTRNEADFRGLDGLSVVNPFAS